MPRDRYTAGALIGSGLPASASAVIQDEFRRLAGALPYPIPHDLGTLTASVTLKPQFYTFLALTLGASVTLTIDKTGATTGDILRVACKQDGTGSRLVTWSGVTWFSGTAPTLTTTTGAIDLLEFTYVASAATWYGRPLYTKAVTIGTLTLTNPLTIPNGGTGLSSFTAGDVPYYASGTALSKLAIGAANRVLTSTGTAPQWVDSLTLGGTLSVTGNLAVNTTKFTVAAASGNTVVAGTFDVTGAATLNSTLAVTSTATFSSTSNFTGTANFTNGFNATLGFSRSVANSNSTPLANNGTITLASAANAKIDILEFESFFATAKIVNAGGTVNIVWQNAVTKFSTTAGNVGTINLYFSAGVFTIENKTGSHITLGGEPVRLV